MKKKYNVRWYGNGANTLADVDIITTTLHNAKQSADKMGREFGYSHCLRIIYLDGKQVD